MADYDYALQLDPLNVAAIFNRGLLRMEVRDNDNAIKDFTKVRSLPPTITAHCITVRISTPKSTTLSMRWTTSTAL